jgi:hypothetical protein
MVWGDLAYLISVSNNSAIGTYAASVCMRIKFKEL